jgi:transcriptional regulator with XRE-family HTH domain
MNELEERWRDLGEFIREQRHVGQLSLRKLSEMAGISNPYLSQIERGLRKPSAEILRQIAQALSISAETLYVRAGILDERDGEADLVHEIRRDPFIDEEQKKTLVHIYLSFRSERADRLAATEVLAHEGFVRALLNDEVADAPEEAVETSEADDLPVMLAAADGATAGAVQ